MRFISLWDDIDNYNYPNKLRFIRGLIIITSVALNSFITYFCLKFQEIEFEYDFFDDPSCLVHLVFLKSGDF